MTSGDRLSAQGVVAFFDIDGTLVWRDEAHLNGVPTPRVREALEAFARRGGSCVLCTGRPRGLVVPEVASLPFDGYVTMDGAHVERGGVVVRDVAIDPELVRGALFEMERLGMSAIFESVEVNVSLDMGENWFPNVPSPTTAQGVVDLMPSLRFSKAVFHDHEIDRYESSAFLCENFVLYHLGDGMNELTVRGIDKGAGLRAYVESLPERPRKTIAFGDSENDLPMLESADVGVVMANARPHVIKRVRACGGHVTDSVLEDGVARALERFELI